MKISTVVKQISFIIICAVLWIGCSHQTPLPDIQYYTLVYEKPQAINETAQLQVRIRANPVQTTSFYRTTRIAYATSPYTRGLYSYYHWEDPADKLLHGHIIRGFRDAGLFSDLVLSDSTLPCQFSLTIFVEEFVEMDRGKNRYALLSFWATVEYEVENISQVGQNTPLIIFQKRYQVETPLETKTLTELAKAMSQSVSTASLQLRADLYQEISQRLKAIPMNKPKGK